MAGRVGPHCEHVSPGCEQCYAETNNHRCLPANGTGLPYDRRSRDLVEVIVDEKILLQPLKWRPVKTFNGMLSRNLPPSYRPRRIFVENQSDLFGEWVTDEMLDRVFAVMALCPQHQFQVLTKRPERMLSYVTRLATESAIHRRAKDILQATYMGPLTWTPPNILLGTTVENQEWADRRREPMAQLASLGWRTFVSYEPALGLVNWNGWEFLSWLISGGESGPGARPSHPDWHRVARDFASARFPYFFKQWGEWTEVDGGPPNRVFEIDRHHAAPIDRTNCVIALDGQTPHTEREMRDNVKYRWMSRVGKKAAGEFLDGREWKMSPKVQR